MEKVVESEIVYCKSDDAIGARRSLFTEGIPTENLYVCRCRDGGERK